MTGFSHAKINRTGLKEPAAIAAGSIILFDLLCSEESVACVTYAGSDIQVSLRPSSSAPQ